MLKCCQGSTADIHYASSYNISYVQLVCEHQKKEYSDQRITQTKKNVSCNLAAAGNPKVFEWMFQSLE